MASADQISCRNLGRQSWASAPTPRGGRGTGRRVVGPYGETGKLSQPPRPAAQRGVFAPAGVRDGWESEQRSSPKCTATPGNPSVTAKPCQLPLHKGAFGDGDTDCRVASLLAMTVLNLCHSEEAQRADVGIRPFLRWTGVRAAVPRAWPPPTKFRAEIWGVGQVVGPYGKPKPAGAQRSVRARGREG